MEELKEGIKKAARAFLRGSNPNKFIDRWKSYPEEIGFIKGALSPEAKEYWQQGMYSGEEVRELLTDLLKATGKDIKAEMVEMRTNPHIVFDGNDVEKWFEQNKKK